jgi:MFS family permease
MTVTLFASEALAVAAIMPEVAEDLGRGGYGAAFSTFFLGSVVGVLFGGPLADRFGAARPFAAAAATFAAGLVVGGAAPTMAVLVGGRLLQGIGAGAITPIVYTAIGRAYPEAARLRMFAVISTAWVLPGVLGPGLAGLVAEHAGWRWVFLGLLPLVAVAVGAALPPLRRVPPSPAAASTPLWPRGVARLAAAAARIRPGIPTAVLLRGLLTCAFGAVDAFLPLAITSLRGRSVVFASLAVSLTTLVWTAGAWLADRLGARRGEVRLVRAGLLLLAAGTGAELTLALAGVPLAVGLAGAALAGFGIGLAFSPLASLVLARVEDGQEGTASSALSLFENLGFAAGPGFTGALVAVADARGWADATPFVVAWTAAGLLALGGAALTGRLGVVAMRRQPTVAPAAGRTGGFGEVP